MTTPKDPPTLDAIIDRIHHSFDIASSEVKEGWMREVDAQTRAAQIREEAKADIERLMAVDRQELIARLGRNQ